MKNNLLLLVLIALVTLSCDTKTTEKKTELTAVNSEKSEDSEGLKLLKQHCYVCHSVTTKSHDDIIAPPMVAVKRRYGMSYTSESEFVKAMTVWVLNPVKEHALMRGAVTNFNVMPKLPFNKEDVTKIASYVYTNKLERPIWFQAHFNEEHPNGMGNGQGKGMGNGQGRGKGNF